MTPVNIGIVGTGFMAVAHIKALRQIPEARIAALCNPSGRNLDGDFSNVFGNVGTHEPVRLDMREVKVYHDFAALLADPDIHVVDITTPTPLHAEQAIAALRAGKHVMCEKPLARTSAEARAIVAEAARAKGFLMPAMCLRFWPEWVWLKQAISEGRYGRVLSARFRRVAEPPAWGGFLDGKKSGGALLDMHIHDADFVQFCFGRPRRVFAAGHSSVSGAIDYVSAQYEVANGAVVHAEGSWAMARGFGFNMAYTVNFERATADYDLARGKESLKLFEPDQAPCIVACDGADGYVGEWRHFLESIRTGQPPSVVTAADGVSALEICEAEECSIATGNPVAL
ncbi:MAG: Gfo/Idh/MocA family oxidoreductase [Pedosphaera sp.]|nr:Gfo/Idh/MocA family oxidoreductase [Pedosphaera sp.]MST00331.1 Gfo/Idh/MocA family oxidoreductase [Pedosphaera sp.]